MTFRVGQKVVCIDDTGDRVNRSETFPVKGAIYTVRSTSIYGIHLEEIVNAEGVYRQGYGELYFKAYRFRPVVDRKTDIAVFTKMLTPQDVDA